MRKSKISKEQMIKILDKKKTKPAGIYAEIFFRPFTYPVVLFFIRNNVSGNTVTCIHILLGIIGLFFILIGTKLSIVTGIIFLQLWFFSDLVDGEVARFKEEISVTGIYFDIMSHYIMFPLLFAVFGIYGYQSEKNIVVLYLTIISCIAILLRKLADDGQLTAICIQFRRDANNIYNIESKNTVDDKKTSQNKGNIKTSFVKRTIKVFIDIFYVLNNFPSIMNVICIVLISEKFISNNFPLILTTLLIYSVSLNIIWLRIFFNAINTKKVDKTYFSIKPK